jgi:hypothetical protein
MRLHLAPIAQARAEQVRCHVPGQPNQPYLPIGPILLGDARRRRLGESGVNGGFAAILVCALLLKHSRTEFWK